MNAVKDNTEKEYNEVTLEILDRTKMLKQQVKKNNTIGDTSIIIGIELFEDIIKELNIESIDDENVDFIEKSVEELVTQIEEKRQCVNQYSKYGINCCYTILEGYNNRVNHKYSYSRKRD